MLKGIDKENYYFQVYYGEDHSYVSNDYIKRSPYMGVIATLKHSIIDNQFIFLKYPEDDCFYELCDNKSNTTLYTDIVNNRSANIQINKHIMWVKFEDKLLRLNHIMLPSNIEFAAVYIKTINSVVKLNDNLCMALCISHVDSKNSLLIIDITQKTFELREILKIEKFRDGGSLEITTEYNHKIYIPAPYLQHKEKPLYDDVEIDYPSDSELMMVINIINGK